MAKRKTTKPLPKSAGTLDPSVAEPTGRDGPPFIVDGVDPSNDRRLDADERLAWMEKQQEAMRKGL